MPSRYLDWWICILYLHIWALFLFCSADDRSLAGEIQQELFPKCIEKVSKLAGKEPTAGNIVLELHSKAFTEIELATNRIIDQEFARTLAFNPSVEYKVSSVHNFQRFANIVIRDQDRQPRFSQI